MNNVIWPSTESCGRSLCPDTQASKRGIKLTAGVLELAIKCTTFIESTSSLVCFPSGNTACSIFDPLLQSTPNFHDHWTCFCSTMDSSHDIKKSPNPHVAPPLQNHDVLARIQAACVTAQLIEFTNFVLPFPASGRALAITPRSLSMKRYTPTRIHVNYQGKHSRNIGRKMYCYLHLASNTTRKKASIKSNSRLDNQFRERSRKRSLQVKPRTPPCIQHLAE